MSGLETVIRSRFAKGAAVAGLAAVLLAATVPASASAAARAGWSVVPSPNEGPAPQSSQLFSVSCSSATTCMAVGTYRSRRSPGSVLAESWDGKAWSIVPSPNVAAGERDVLNGVSCTSADRCFAVGAYFISLGAKQSDLTRALAGSWDGERWAIVPSPYVGPAWALTGSRASLAQATERAWRSDIAQTV